MHPYRDAPLSMTVNVYPSRGLLATKLAAQLALEINQRNEKTKIQKKTRMKKRELALRSS